jgi:hypothetical protein
MQTNNESGDDTERRIDEALEESFPASDPPCFVGAALNPANVLNRAKSRGSFGKVTATPLISQFGTEAINGKQRTLRR